MFNLIFPDGGRSPASGRKERMYRLPLLHSVSGILGWNGKCGNKVNIKQGSYTALTTMKMIVVRLGFISRCGACFDFGISKDDCGEILAFIL